MNTDRELLELAAKAAGLVILTELQGRRDAIGVDGLGLATKDKTWWNPMVDNGDCARLCATLGICTEWAGSRVICVCGGYYNYTVFADHNGDKSSAWRKAAVKVAANFGRAMP